MGLVVMFVWPPGGFIVLSFLTWVCGMAPLVIVWAGFLLFLVPVYAAYMLMRFDSMLRARRGLDPEMKFGVIRSLVFYLLIVLVQFGLAIGGLFALMFLRSVIFYS
ncbi:MAG: hypothetical protein Q7R41_20445 [Phycisphaerales bacterium]|nr:hypothetical protein [Phycisphaerales bacterium]